MNKIPCRRVAHIVKTTQGKEQCLAILGLEEFSAEEMGEMVYLLNEIRKQILEQRKELNYVYASNG